MWSGEGSIFGLCHSKTEKHQDACHNPPTGPKLEKHKKIQFKAISTNLAADLCVALSSSTPITVVAEWKWTHLRWQWKQMLITGDSRLLRQMKVVCVIVEVIQPQNTGENGYNTEFGTKITLRCHFSPIFPSLDESAGVAN